MNTRLPFFAALLGFLLLAANHPITAQIASEAQVPDTFTLTAGPCAINIPGGTAWKILSQTKDHFSALDATTHRLCDLAVTDTPSLTSVTTPQFINPYTSAMKKNKFRVEYARSTKFKDLYALQVLCHGVVNKTETSIYTLFLTTKGKLYTITLHAPSPTPQDDPDLAAFMNSINFTPPSE